MENKLSETEQTTCPLCGRKLTWLNKSLNKIEGKRICGSCSGKLSIAFPNRFNFNGITKEQALEAVESYAERMSAPAAQTAKQAPRKACCPHCGSQNIVPMGHKHKNYSLGKVAGASLIFNPALGLAAGFLGKTEKKVEFYCQNCGKVFKR